MRSASQLSKRWRARQGAQILVAGEPAHEAVPFLVPKHTGAEVDLEVADDTITSPAGFMGRLPPSVVLCGSTDVVQPIAASLNDDARR
jgi:hypothetical protein